MRNVDDEEPKKETKVFEYKWRKWMFDMVMEYDVLQHMFLF